MPLPMQLIDILASQTAAENMQCADCDGAGEIGEFSPETGHEPVTCGTCLGTGYNQLGLILSGILKPPAEGFGPVELKDALSAYLQELARKQPSDSELGRSLRLAIASFSQENEPSDRLPEPSGKRRAS